MSANLRLMESQSSPPDLRLSPRTFSDLEGPVNHGPLPALDRLSVPAAPYLDPTPLQRAGRVGWQMGIAAVDLTFGTHWAITKRLQSSHYLRRIRQDNLDVSRLLAGDPLLARASAPLRRDAMQNAQALLALNRHGHSAAQVRKYLYGDAVVAGGLPFGAGLTIGPQIGGGLSAALTAASVPLLWVGAPILAGAAIGVAAHEGVRFRRAAKLQKRVPRVGLHAVMGNEPRVQALLAARLRSKRIHASTKSISLIGCAISAPLMVVGIIPGIAMITPAATAFIWAWYYHHNRLRYRPSLTAAERIMLGSRRDIINRIDLAHQVRTTLKGLKEQKRLLYPKGAQGILGLRESAKSLAWARRKWGGVPHSYPGPRTTVFKFLQELANHEVEFVRHQEALQQHASAKLLRGGPEGPDEHKRRFELASQRESLNLWLADRTAESRILNGFEAPPDAPTVARHFLVFLQRYRLTDRFTREAILRKAPVKHRFLEAGALVQDKKSFHFELAHLSRAMDTQHGPPEEKTQRLAGELCHIAEHWLFKREKKRLTFYERELLDILAYRLEDDQGVRRRAGRHGDPSRAGSGAGFGQ